MFRLKLINTKKPVLSHFQRLHIYIALESYVYSLYQEATIFYTWQPKTYTEPSS